MVDIDTTAKSIEQHAIAAEHGDADALRHLRLELKGLTSEELKQVAAKNEKDIGSSSTKFLEGAQIKRDPQGDVMSITFHPSFTDRLRGSGAHSIRTTLSVVENVNASPEHVHKVKEAFDHLPPRIKEMLVDHEYKITTANYISDARPDLKYKHPRGYPPGDTWDESTAFADKDQMVISEHYIDKIGNIYLYDRAEGAVRHETGHVADALLNHASDSRAFQTAYRKDVDMILPDDREKLAYYLQEDGGRQETFAELFAQITGGGGAYPVEKSLIDKYFTNTRMVVEKEIIASN